MDNNVQKRRKSGTMRVYILSQEANAGVVVMVMVMVECDTMS